MKKAILGLLALIALVTTCSFGMSSGDDKTGIAATATMQATAPMQDTSTMNQTTKADATSQKKSDGISGDGTWMIPSDVKPGNYKATVPSKSYGCYWARLSGTSGELNDIIANGTETAGTPVLVTIGASDKAFKTSRCGAWTRISD
jgi:hypothetical protein